MGGQWWLFVVWAICGGGPSMGVYFLLRVCRGRLVHFLGKNYNDGNCVSQN